MHAFFDREGDLALIVKDDGYFSGVIAIYGASGDHYPMVVGHAAPTGYKIKGALREVNVHAGANFFVSPGLMETCSTLWRSYAVESLVDLVGVATLSWMRHKVVLLNSLGRLV